MTLQPVFISSTSRDLPEYRAAVVSACAELGLDAFKGRLCREQIVRWFTTPHDLLHQAYRALEGWLERQGVRPRGPRQLPSPPADFVGRVADLALLEGQRGGVTITGVHGQGG